MKAYYSDSFVLPLPEGHRFPMAKYRLLRETLVAEGVLQPDELVIPSAATDGQLATVHDRDYLRRVAAGELDRHEVRAMGFPWSPQLVERSRRSVGATIEALAQALDDGYAVNLAGGTHHAFSDKASGYCVFNDAAVAIRVHQQRGRIRRALVVDCDVHQGDGTAAIFRDDASVFTLSLHGRRNFPFRKQESDLDIELEDGTGDEAYLEALDDALEKAGEAGRYDAMLYLAGADPFENDKLGRLALSRRGLAARDRRVLDFADRAGLPVAVVMSGGYADPVEDIVAIHLQTVREARERWARRRTGAPV